MRCLLALALLLSAAWCPTLATAQDDDPLSPAQRAWLETHGPIRVGVASDGAPNGFVEDDAIKGFAPDLALLAALKVGVDVELVPLGLRDVATALEAGDVHVTGIWADRGDLGSFGTRTRPAAWVPIMFVTVDHPEFVTQADLEGNVGVLDGSVMEQRLREDFPHLTPVRYATTPQGVQMLVDGDVNALLAPLPAVGYELAALGIDGGLPVGEPLSIEPTYFWAHGDDPVPGQILDAGLARISNGEMAVIHIKWTGFDLTDPARADAAPDNTPVYLALAIVAVFAAIGLVANHRYRRQQRAIASLVSLARSIEGGQLPAPVDVGHMPTGPAAIGRAMNQMVPRIRLQRGFLEEQVRERTEALDRKTAELQDFIHATSHDLRQPLRSVRGFLDLLPDDLGRDLPLAAARDVERASKGADRMEEMLDALMEFSRVETDASEPETVDMDALLARVLEDLGGAVLATGADVQVGPLPDVQASKEQMHMLFQNLIGNAIKFHKDGVRPEVVVRGEPIGGQARFEVKDNGIGIPEEHRERVFAIFQRLHGRDTHEGYGVGLAICKRIVERHHGRIDVTSSEDGTTFQVFLPLAVGSAALEGLHDVAAARGAPHR